MCAVSEHMKKKIVLGNAIRSIKTIREMIFKLKFGHHMRYI